MGIFAHSLYQSLMAWASSLEKRVICLRRRRQTISQFRRRSGDLCELREGGLQLFDDLKLIRCPRSLAPTLVTLPSMSLIPFAPFSRDHIRIREIGAVLE